MKGFKKEDEYLIVEVVNEDYRKFSEIYNIAWNENDAIEDFLTYDDIKNENIIEIHVSRCKNYTKED